MQLSVVQKTDVHEEKVGDGVSAEMRDNSHGLLSALFNRPIFFLISLSSTQLNFLNPQKQI